MQKAKVCLLQPHYTNEIEVYRKLLIPATVNQMMVVIHFLLFANLASDKWLIMSSRLYLVGTGSTYQSYVVNH